MLFRSEWFLSQLELYTRKEAAIIIGQTLSVLDKLPVKNGWSQETAGVIKKDKPIFFLVEYLHQEEEPIILIDLIEIEIEEYLDFISNKKSIKSYYDTGQN